MHNFSELSAKCATFTLGNLGSLEEKTLEEMRTKGTTSLIKTLQMIRLEKAIFAIGIFSIFESISQERLNCRNGFEEIKEILRQNNEDLILSQFIDLERAINSLKHGRGKSYNALISKIDPSTELSAKKVDQPYLDEGEVSEITALVDVDDKFIISCVELISKVSDALKIIRPDIDL